MNEQTWNNLAGALLMVAQGTENIKSQIDYDSLNRVLLQCSEMFKGTEKIDISESLAIMLSQFGESAEKITDLQKIAISKSFNPRDLVLSEEQGKIRNAITKNEATVLLDSQDIDVSGKQFKYKNSTISQNKVKEAIRTLQLFDDVSLDEILEFSNFLYRYGDARCLFDKLDSLSHVSTEMKREHVSEIKETQRMASQGICPICKGQLVLRTAKNTGSKFYGCSNYPKCKFTKNY